MKIKNIIVALSLGVCFSNALFGYKFLFTAHSDGGIVAIADDNGKIHWSMPARHPQRADISSDGKFIFISEIHGARMVDMASKKTIWAYKCPTVTWSGVETKKIKKGDKITLENPVAQILEKDRFLVGNEGRSTLLEINSKGEVLKEIKGESENVVKHGEIRLASKDEQGRYIFPMTASSLLTVYNSDGKQLLRIKTPAGVVGAEFISDTSILTGGIYGIIIYDTNAKKLWEFDSIDLQKALNTKNPVIICDVKKLPSGNLLCTTYGNKSIPDVLEISPDKKIVKIIDFPYTHFSALQLLDDDGKPLR